MKPQEISKLRNNIAQHLPWQAIRLPREVVTELLDAAEEVAEHTGPWPNCVTQMEKRWKADLIEERNLHVAGLEAIHNAALIEKLAITDMCQQQLRVLADDNIMVTQWWHEEGQASTRLVGENKRLEYQNCRLEMKIEQLQTDLAASQEDAADAYGRLLACQEREKGLRDALEFYAKAGYNAEIAKQALEGGAE